MDRHAHHRGAVRVARRGVGQIARRAHRRLRAEKTIVVVAHNEVQCLARLIRRTRADRSRPAERHLRPRVFQHRFVVPLDETGRVIHRIHRQGEGHRIRDRSTGIPGFDRHRGRSIEVRGWMRMNRIVRAHRKVRPGHPDAQSKTRIKTRRVHNPKLKRTRIGVGHILRQLRGRIVQMQGPLLIQAQIRDLTQDGRVVHRRHTQTCRVRQHTVGRRRPHRPAHTQIHGRPGRPRALIPAVIRDRRHLRILAVRHIPNAVTVRQQQRPAHRHRSKWRPARRPIRRILPRPVACLPSHRDPLHRPRVHIRQSRRHIRRPRPAHHKTRDQLRRRRRVLIRRPQTRRVLRQHRRVIHRRNRHRKRVGYRINAAICGAPVISHHHRDRRSTTRIGHRRKRQYTRRTWARVIHHQVRDQQAVGRAG